MPEMSGAEFLGEARLIDGVARRVMLVTRGDRDARQMILDGRAFGQIESFIYKPQSEAPDEQFHHRVAELLYEWSHAHRQSFEAVTIVGRRWSERSYELRNILRRNGLPTGFYCVEDEDGRSVLQRYGLDSSARLPVVIVFGSRALSDPTNREVAEALGVKSSPGGETCDLVVIGAGPAGLAAAMYASSEGLETVVIEREAIGGQAGQSAHIQNYLGFPAGIGGEELALRAYEQAWQFGAQFLFANEAVGLRATGPRWTVELADGSSLCARAVIIANGISYRRLGIAALDSLVGAGVFYGSVASEARSLRGADVVVAGGGNSAGQAALHLARYAGRVVLVTRHDSLARTMSSYLIVRLQETQNVETLLNNVVIDGEGEERLAAVTVEDQTTGRRERLRADGLFVLIGARPHTAWLPRALARDDGGYILTGADIIVGAGGGISWPLDRPPHPLETSLPGVFAVGDVRSGSVKRVASAVGEGAVAVRLCHRYLSEREVEKAA